MGRLEQITDGKKRKSFQERYSLSSSSSSTSVAVSSSAKSKTSATEAAEVVSQTVREESVERVVLSSSLDEVDELLQALQHTQEHKVLLNIGGVKYETSQVTLRNDPSSVCSIMLLPNSPFRPSGNVFFFDRIHHIFASYWDTSETNVVRKNAYYLNTCMN